uniref:Reverse transcriptase/retrotransposon-derived protein RNase H-like domain-containing protein n=1 Tax=Seriola dumerili TaxID=41447 RepID=A0A3B4V9P0_SERDU
SQAVLRAATLKETPPTIQWTEEMRHAFHHVKYMLCSAPALGLPDYKLTLHLYVAEDGNVAVAVLVQMHGGRPRPVAYYSKTLPLNVKGMVSCLRAVAAAAIMVEKAQTYLWSRMLL